MQPARPQNTSSQTTHCGWLLHEQHVSAPGALQGDFMQTDVLHGCPDNRETTRLRRKHIDLICPLSHVTKEALNRIGGLNVACIVCAKA